MSFLYAPTSGQISVCLLHLQVQGHDEDLGYDVAGGDDNAAAANVLMCF